MGEYQTTHDWEGDHALSDTLAEAIATVRDNGSVEGEEVSSVINLAAVDSLFGSFDGTAPSDGDGRVELTLDGLLISVTASGDITVRQAGDVPQQGVTTEAAFRAELERLVREAEANGVDVEGGWGSAGGTGRPEWGIEIYEVRRVDIRTRS